MTTPVWHDAERLPNLSMQAQHRLRWLIEHPHAPRYNNRSGHRLRPEEQTELLRLTGIEWASSPPAYTNVLPGWLPDFLRQCAQQVPYYRQYVPDAPLDLAAFRALPTLDRGDLCHDIARFVPTHLPLDRLFKFTTTGTTGHRLTIPTHPMVAARYAIYHQKILARYGIDLSAHDSNVAVMLAGYQERCFTYASVVPGLGERALLKLNFHRSDWSHPDDRQAYIDATCPALITGDPLSLHELAQLSFRHSPLAVLSTSMTLTAGQQLRLQQRFRCPVIDLYSMNEAGPIGARLLPGEGLRLLQSRLLVEILDAKGNVLPDGQRGEITLTGGFNDYLPLVRYRTGDFACLRVDDGEPVLHDFEGRQPVRYRTDQGHWVNNIEITHALQPFPLPQFAFHQTVSGAVDLRVRGDVSQVDAITRAVQGKLGPATQVTVLSHHCFADKVIQYTSDLPGALP